jgi:large subunit ribosomal protein L25
MSELQVQTRAALGTSKVKQLRAKGVIPAELYGYDIDNMHLAIEAKVAEKMYKEAGTNTVITINIDGKQKEKVLIYDVQKDPVLGDLISIDFNKVNMKEKVETEIPVVLVGESPAVEDKGGILTQAMREVMVEALPDDLPHEITVDISGLVEIGDSLYVKDLPKGKGYEYVTEEDTVVVSIGEPEEEEEEEIEEITPDQVIVEGEEKRAEKDKKEAAEE